MFFEIIILYQLSKIIFYLLIKFILLYYYILFLDFNDDWFFKFDLNDKVIILSQQCLFLNLQPHFLFYFFKFFNFLYFFIFSVFLIKFLNNVMNYYHHHHNHNPYFYIQGKIFDFLNKFTIIMNPS